MSNRKSLGSSPIGYHSDGNTLDFIPDLTGNGNETDGNSPDKAASAAKPSPRPDKPVRLSPDRKSRRDIRRKASPVQDFRKKQAEKRSAQANSSKSSTGSENGSDFAESEKKIVSYYLEKDLIDRIKEMASENGSYYSALVGEALLKWVEKHGY